MEELLGIDTSTIFNQITDKLSTWFSAGISLLPNLILAILVILATVFIGRSVKSLSQKYMIRLGTNETISRFLSQLFFLGILVLGIMMALSVMDLSKTVSSILAGLGIAGLALGFAFQDTAANFMSGIFITFNQPYKIGDVIESKDGHQGTVVDINLRVTKIQSFNGLVVHVPNRLLFQEYFINYSENKKRRVQIDCGVSYGEDLEHVQRVALEAMQDLPHRLKSEEPSIFWTGFGDSSINFTLNIWVQYSEEQKDFIPGRNEAILSLKKSFDQEGITIPFPIRTLDFGIKGGKTLTNQLSQLSLVESTSNGTK
ncbi:mechanosensitive ion channel family protein [Algoriphagus namhaensis]|uniref:Mechanosensitive ion channel family protein n=1 Tax=Algoriphagus namhaensis TaxID=915353 RepID=A0ABV8AUI7_9BACT